MLGTLTFWQPSLALVLLYLLALPLAALGAWLAAARLTAKTTLRVFAGLAYALAPTLLMALQGGRPAAVLAHILLPWLFFAGLAARRSWAASATTALLAAATVGVRPDSHPGARRRLDRGASPSPAAAQRGSSSSRVPAIVLFAPLVWQQAARGAWLSVLRRPRRDPGCASDAGLAARARLPRRHPRRLAHAGGRALHPGRCAEHHRAHPARAAGRARDPGALPARDRAARSWRSLVALAGFLTAVTALHLQLATTGGTVVPIWPGTAVSLYWLGLIGAAVLALSAVGRAAAYPAWVAIVTLAIVAVPAAVAMHDRRLDRPGRATAAPCRPS